jgi:hypothetical protein
MRLAEIIAQQKVLFRHEGASTRVTPLYEPAEPSPARDSYVQPPTKLYYSLGRNIDLQA